MRMGMARMQEQLARFPSDAVLKALSWRCSCCTGDRALLLPSVLPSLFLEAAPKLASLRSLTLSGDMVRCGSRGEYRTPQGAHGCVQQLQHRLFSLAPPPHRLTSGVVVSHYSGTSPILVVQPHTLP